jgi:hypothetical protein
MLWPQKVAAGTMTQEEVIKILAAIEENHHDMRRNGYSKTRSENGSCFGGGNLKEQGTDKAEAGWCRGRGQGNCTGCGLTINLI